MSLIDKTIKAHLDGPRSEPQLCVVLDKFRKSSTEGDYYLVARQDGTITYISPKDVVSINPSDTPMVIR